MLTSLQLTLCPEHKSKSDLTSEVLPDNDIPLINSYLKLKKKRAISIYTNGSNKDDSCQVSVIC